MFLSTVVPATRLNVNSNKNISPYNFSVPYNFVRGRKLILTLHPLMLQEGHSNTNSGLCNDMYPMSQAATTNPNTYQIIIPDDVTTYNTTVKVSLWYIQGPSHFEAVYTVDVTFDITSSIITFTPTAYTGRTDIHLDGNMTSAVLLVISTIL